MTVETMTLMEVSQILRISEHTARNRLSMGLPADSTLTRTPIPRASGQ